MSRGINKMTVVGNLGDDAVFHSNGNGVSISVATTESWKDKNTGEIKEETEWHRVVIFGNTANNIGEYLKKGTQVYVEGKLKTRKWQDQNGIDRYTTEIIVDMKGTIELLGRAPQQNEQYQQPMQQGYNHYQAAQMPN